MENNINYNSCTCLKHEHLHLRTCSCPRRRSRRVVFDNGSRTCPIVKVEETRILSRSERPRRIAGQEGMRCKECRRPWQNPSQSVQRDSDQWSERDVETEENVERQQEAIERKLLRLTRQQTWFSQIIGKKRKALVDCLSRISPKSRTSGCSNDSPPLTVMIYSKCTCLKCDELRTKRQRKYQSTKNNMQMHELTSPGNYYYYQPAVADRQLQQNREEIAHNREDGYRNVPNGTIKSILKRNCYCDHCQNRKAKPPQ